MTTYRYRDRDLAENKLASLFSERAPRSATA